MGIEITAKIAKSNADNVNHACYEAELNTILKEIKIVSERGKYSVSGYTSLMDETINKLKSLGFNVESGGRMNEVEFNISWDKSK